MDMDDQKGLPCISRTLIIKLFLESNVEDMIQNVEDSLVLNPIWLMTDFLTMRPRWIASHLNYKVVVRI